MQNKASIVGLHDKGKAAILEVEVLSYEKETGEPLCMNRTTVYLRGAGGFSKSSQPYSFSKYPKDQTASKTPKTRPFIVHEECTQPQQVSPKSQKRPRFKPCWVIFGWLGKTPETATGIPVRPRTSEPQAYP
ncbi:enoyl-CoA hydratase 2, peroxisomal, partial [Tanacetum coccineum]